MPYNLIRPNVERGSNHDVFVPIVLRLIFWGITFFTAEIFDAIFAPRTGNIATIGLLDIVHHLTERSLAQFPVCLAARLRTTSGQKYNWGKNAVFAGFSRTYLGGVMQSDQDV